MTTPPTLTDRTYPRSRAVVFGLIAAVALVIDLGSKSLVFGWYGMPGHAEWSWEFKPFLWFTLQTNVNHGALWGMGQGWASLFAVLSLIAVVVIAHVLFILGYARSLWLTVALAFVTSGALGNGYDRLGWHGLKTATGAPDLGVRDFLYFRFFESFDWPLFNFADSFLVTGAIMLMIQSLWSDVAVAAATTPKPMPVPAADSSAKPV